MVLSCGCLVFSCSVVSCRVVSCRVVFCFVLICPFSLPPPSLVWSCLVLSCLALPCHYCLVLFCVVLCCGLIFVLSHQCTSRQWLLLHPLAAEVDGIYRFRVLSCRLSCLCTFPFLAFIVIVVFYFALSIVLSFFLSLSAKLALGLYFTRPFLRLLSCLPFPLDYNQKKWMACL
jgi:hypothetical protein